MFRCDPIPKTERSCNLQKHIVWTGCPKLSKHMLYDLSGIECSYTNEGEVVYCEKYKRNKHYHLFFNILTEFMLEPILPYKRYYRTWKYYRKFQYKNKKV